MAGKWAKTRVQQFAKDWEQANIQRLIEAKQTPPPVTSPTPPRKRRKYKTKWTDEEEEFLIKNYERLTRYALAWRLRCTKMAVNLKIQSLIESGRIPEG